jgi:Peptidase C39 family
VFPACHERGCFIGRLALPSILVVTVSGWARAAGDEPKDSGEYCGLYCVYSALSAIGRDVPFETLLRPRYLSSWEGSSIKELRQAVIDAGAHAIALSGLGAESLRSARKPMVLHVASDGQLKRYNHWVVFCGMENEKALLLDAPNPMQLVPLSDILARWDGTALVVSDDPAGARSIEVGEGVFHLSVIVLALLVVCLAD